VHLTAADREVAAAAFQRAWGRPLAPSSRPSMLTVPDWAHIGRARLRRASPVEAPSGLPAGAPTMRRVAVVAVPRLYPDVSMGTALDEP
jgi:hypothetical protein